MVDVVMLAAPYFVFALLAGVISKLAGDNPAGVLEIFKGLGVYSLVVLIGLGFMVFVVYPSIMYLFTKKTYSHFFKSIASEILRPQVYNNKKMAWFLDIIHWFSFLLSKALNSFLMSLIVIGLGSFLSFFGESSFETAELKIL